MSTLSTSSAMAHRIRHTFMHFKQVKRILARAAELMATDWSGSEPEHLVVFGETGVGKSTALERILRKHPKTEHATFTEFPVLYVEVPARCTIARLCSVLLQALGSPFWNKGKDEERQDALIALMKKCKVRLVIIDEINHRKRGLKAVLTRPQPRQMSTTCRSSAKPTRQVVPSPGSMVAVRWLMRTMVPTTVLRCLSSKATFSPQRKSLRPARGGGGGSGGAAGLGVPGAGGSTAV